MTPSELPPPPPPPRNCGESNSEITVPLVVDVDGSLVGGDLLIEGAFQLLAVSPLTLFAFPFWLTKGRAVLKRRIARAIPLPPATLVLNPCVMEEIAASKAAGREVWLASASDELVVTPLVEAVGAQGCFASDSSTNLAGQAKAAALVKTFGERGFDYIGNERRDLEVWKHARRAIGVNLSAGLAREVRVLDNGARFLPGLGGRPLDYLWALRPRHWIKNALVFAPLVAAHETRPETYLAVAGVFAALSVCASGMYLFNDLLDLPHDRRHRSKHHRPLAAGKVRLDLALVIVAALPAVGLALAFWLSTSAGLCVLLYLALTVAYSLWLKRWIFADIVVLAGLFAIRVLAGAQAVSITLSPWFLAFFMFVFLALAVVKRQSELHALHEIGRSAADGRAYVAKDLTTLTSLGVASGFASVVVLTLYIQSPEVSRLYARQEFLWLACPLLVYWLGRMTLLANRGAADDPVVFAMGDRSSWLTAIGILVVFALAVWPWGSAT